MGYCPFQSGPMFDTAGVFVNMHQEPCPQSTDCQLWDANKGECSLKLGGIYNYHMHDSHWHQKNHEASEVPAGLGPPTQPGVPYASVLMNEFTSNQDKDDNGKVYGYDFKVENTSDRPFVLDPIEDNPKWQDPETTVKWADLLAWYNDPNNNPDPLA